MFGEEVRVVGGFLLEIKFSNEYRDQKISTAGSYCLIALMIIFDDWNGFDLILKASRNRFRVFSSHEHFPWKRHAYDTKLKDKNNKWKIKLIYFENLENDINIITSACIAASHFKFQIPNWKWNIVFRTARER